MNRILKRALIVVAILALVVIVGDWIYATVIAARIRRWESSVKRDADQVQIGCSEFQVGTGDHAILLIHGINDSPACYREMADALAEKGFACRAMRLPGFAKPTEEYAAGNRDRWLKAIDDEVKQLRAEHDRVAIVAHSLGGALTIRYVRENPKSNDAIALLAPAVDVASDRSPVLPPRTWHNLAGVILNFTTITQSPFGLDAKVANDKTYPYRSPFAPRSLFDETFHLIEENRDHAAQIQTPTLMLLSPDDRVIDSKAAEVYWQSIPAEPKRLEKIEDTGHSMTVDHKWPELVAHIDAFFRECEVGKPE